MPNRNLGTPDAEFTVIARQDGTMPDGTAIRAKLEAAGFRFDPDGEIASPMVRVDVPGAILVRQWHK